MKSLVVMILIGIINKFYVTTALEIQGQQVRYLFTTNQPPNENAAVKYAT
jgi:hypothetical protein